MCNYYYFFIKGHDHPIGYSHRAFVEQMTDIWTSVPGWALDHEKRYLTLTGATTFDERSAVVEKTLRAAVNSGRVKEVRSWVNEPFRVVTSNNEHVLNMDGSGLSAFGVINFACHLIGYVMTKDGRKFWVPRRSRHKMSYPGMLDNTTGGSLNATETPFECIVRECEEEISLEPEYTRSNIVACGTAGFHLSRTDSGDPGCQLQVQYLYEMELSQDVIPKIGDDEVDEILLLTLDEVKQALINGEFKLNCAMTWLAFLIRHGDVTAEEEQNLLEICARLHRKHDLFVV